ncbi:hypothetical protein T439DRAFT_151213 [Meredithblackwellia eburnea MCA 4105]
MPPQPNPCKDKNPDILHAVFWKFEKDYLKKPPQIVPITKEEAILSARETSLKIRKLMTLMNGERFYHGPFYQCLSCNVYFRGLDDIKKHFGWQSKTWSCSRCQSTFTRQYLLTKHQMTCGNEINTSPTTPGVNEGGAPPTDVGGATTQAESSRPADPKLTPQKRKAQGTLQETFTPLMEKRARLLSIRGSFRPASWSLPMGKLPNMKPTFSRKPSFP